MVNKQRIPTEQCKRRRWSRSEAKNEREKRCKDNAYGKRAGSAQSKKCKESIVSESGETFETGREAGKGEEC